MRSSALKGLVFRPPRSNPENGVLSRISCACGCNRSELDSFHSNWKKLSLSPLAGSIYLQQAETSPCTWNVQANGDRITFQRVSMRSLQQPDKLRVQFAGGTLVGEDRGEWGGSLSVLEDSNRTPREILRTGIRQIVQECSPLPPLAGVSGMDLRLLYVQYLAHDDHQNFNFLFRLR
jgi:hypothetical protein